MTINGRIKELRKKLGLTQKEFCEKLQITHGALSKIESGDNSPSKQTVFLICSSYGVSDTWLQTGDGEMFGENPPPAQPIRRAEDIVDAMLRTFRGLSEAQQLAVLEYADRLIEELSEEQTIEDKVESYRQELLAEKGATELSGASRNTAG